MQLHQIRKQVEKFLQELSWEWYRHNAGLKQNSDLSAVYEKYAGLADPQVINVVREALEEETGDEARRLQFLLEFSFSTQQGYETRRVEDAILTEEAKAKVVLNGEAIPYRVAPIVLRDSSNRERRAALQDAIDRVVEKLNPRRSQMLNTVHRLAGDWGYESFREAKEQVSAIDFGDIEERTKALLKHTEDMYVEAMTWFLKKKVGIPLHEAEAYDSAYLFRAKEYDGFFTQTDLLPTLRKFVTAMGLDIYAGGNITFDVEHRPTKSPRAFCCPIEVPRRVILVTKPQGGLSDYESFLHELGHALHFGYVDAALPLEYRHLGDDSVTEAYAILFDHLTMDEQWVRGYVGMSAPSDYLQYVHLLELFMLRRYSAKFTYELELHSDGANEHMGKLYSSSLTEATKLRYRSVNYLNDVDPDFYSVRYLRAWMLEGHLRRYLRDTYDVDWFRNPKSGPFLTEMWRAGQSQKAEEVAASFGCESLSFEPIVEAIEQHLGSG